MHHSAGIPTPLLLCRARAALLLILGMLGGASAQAAAERQSLESLRQTAEAFVRTQLPGGAAARAVKVEIGALDERLRLAPCAAPPVAALPQGTSVGARMTVGLRCAQPAWAVYVPVTVQSEVMALVTLRALQRNATLSAADVQRETRWVPGFASAYVTTLEALAGRHLAQAVPAGAALKVQQFAADVLVKRGQRVTLLATNGGFEVRAQGEAVADAGAGGRVRVRNLNSMTVVEGVAESATLVRVN